MKIKLKNVPVGTTFTVWNRKFTVLRQDRNETFVLMAEFAKKMPFKKFEEKCKTAPNDFRTSDIKAYLNGEFINELEKSGADRFRDLSPLLIDLKCTMGQLEYGFDSAWAGLLTLEQYGRFYDLIPLLNQDWWFLATPWKTPNHSPCAGSTNEVWCVYTDGECGGDYCEHSRFVRPVLNLNPALLVTVGGKKASADKPKRERSLSDFTLDELLDEIKRRHDSMKG